MIDPPLQIFDGRFRDQTAFRQKTFEAVDGIALFPESEEFRRHVAGVIVSGMTGHAERLAFN